MVLRLGREVRGGERGKVVEHDCARYGERVPIPRAAELPVARPEPRTGEIEVNRFRRCVDLGFDRDGGCSGGWIVRNQGPALNPRDELPIFGFDVEWNRRLESDREMLGRFQRE